MFSLDNLASDRLHTAVYQAANRVEVREAVAEVYLDLSERIARR